MVVGFDLWRWGFIVDTRLVYFVLYVKTFRDTDYLVDAVHAQRYSKVHRVQLQRFAWYYIVIPLLKLRK